jgi:hypothetical protein
LTAISRAAYLSRASQVIPPAGTPVGLTYTIVPLHEGFIMSKLIRPQPFSTSVQKPINQSTTRQAGVKPVAPPVYRPQPTPQVLQRKTAQGPVSPAGAKINPQRPAAPPAYRPQNVPKVLQAKMAAARQPAKQTGSAPVPPPVYRPQPAPGVLQQKQAGSQPPPKGTQIKPIPGVPVRAVQMKRDLPVPQKVHSQLKPRVVANQVRVQGQPSTPVQAKMAVNALQKTSAFSRPTSSSSVIQMGAFKNKRVKTKAKTIGRRNKSGLRYDSGLVKGEQSGQIYGIWKNEQYPNEVQDSSLSDSKCLYIGKTARGDDLGGRFVEHCDNDTDKPWHKSKADYKSKDHEKWSYVVRNVWRFNGVTKFDVAVAEQFYLQHYTTEGAKILNLRNELSAKKFKKLASSKAFSTKKYYGSWKPENVFSLDSD